MKTSLEIENIINERTRLENPEIAKILYYRYLELFFYREVLKEYTYPQWKESFDFLLAGSLGCLTPRFTLLFGEALLDYQVKCDTQTEANLYHENYKLLSTIVSNLLSTIGQSR